MFNWLYKKYFEIFKGVSFGEGVVIKFPVNLYNCCLDDFSFVGPFTEIQNKCYVGKFSRISSHSFLAAGTVVGDRVFWGHGAKTVNDKNPRVNNKNWKCEGVTIQEDSFVGTNATLNAGTVIYKGGKLGCGAVLTKDIGVGETWVGNPARKLR